MPAPRKRGSEHSDGPRGSDPVTVEHLKAAIAAAVSPLAAELKSELKWHRAVIGLLVASNVLPQLGGPDVAEKAQQAAQILLSYV